MEDGLSVALHEGRGIICVRGRATFKVSPSLKEFASAAIDEGVSSVIFDLARCESMDSTFMGVLAGLALRLRKEADGRVTVVNLTPRTSGLLEQLGLDHLLHCATAEEAVAIVRQIMPNADLSELGEGESDERKALDTMLTAHQDLVDACPDNLVKFTDVITYLKQAQKDLS